MAALAGSVALAISPAALAQHDDSPPPGIEYAMPVDVPLVFNDGPAGEQDGLTIEHSGELTMPAGQIAPYMMPGAEGDPWYESPLAPDVPPPTYCRSLTWLGFRHSYTHGRNVGWGWPLAATSWLNRPYYTGGTLGPIWMTRRVESSVGRDVDLVGTVFFGWDWDHYWGSEFQYAYATPELVNSSAPDAQRGDRLVHWNYSLMYYPWGDATLRPYWRFGVGDTKFDFPDDAGVRQDTWLLTLPIGVGVKYPLRRWLATRAEFTDQISVGAGGVATQHNLTLTFGLECRYGARQKSYWPWNPSSYIW